MGKNQRVDFWSAEEIGLWSTVTGELERLGDAARQSELTYLRGIETLAQNMEAVNKRLADLERGYAKKQRVREEKLHRIRKELEELGMEPPMLRKEAFNLWWVRFRQTLQALEEAVPDRES